MSLKLRESFPGLKCLAFCCPGGLVSKNLAYAMRRFTTCGAHGWGMSPMMVVMQEGMGSGAQRRAGVCAAWVMALQCPRTV